MHKKPEATLQTTRLWEDASQHCRGREQGAQHYAGATPGQVIWNPHERYNRKNDPRVDPHTGERNDVGHFPR